ncbi:hypothetical protein ACWT_6928 [Actinoplanes sp. SE50]|uniref:hypothetical protein n=1 Tax=unclassified Actinoplanes TaxID=2626549 RepID=UPI00023EBC5A|nr:MULTISPECIES: hypothetical protein [unclassified Actinoplanes]AEV87939.1 hypothetical protein ACPL_7059 [Actinoplanes sp. SE50/110]ATO86343.1 hypothetical protein ACWT_6928 [Actinoplanes sp. SE50]SLM03758.1 hypothetical protein ACSP50_7057 [Actinoplanes sp. SE50/110]
MITRLLGALLAAVAVPFLAYRAGRTHAAWQDARSTRRSLRQDRRTAWAHTARLAAGALVLLAGLTAAALGLF